MQDTLCALLYPNQDPAADRPSLYLLSSKKTANTNKARGGREGKRREEKGREGKGSAKIKRAHKLSCISEQNSISISISPYHT